METRICTIPASENPHGEMVVEVSLDLDDLAQLKGQAARAYEIERALPPEARTPLGSAREDAYTSAFIQTRAANDALELHGIVPVAAPRVSTSGMSSGDLYRCTVRLIPRPDIGLTSLNPLELKTRRVAMPGISAKAAEGDPHAAFVDDEKVLRRALIDHLDAEVPENAIRALANEYQANFERELSGRNIDPESYQLAHGLNEDQYLLMMARTALSDAHWNYALDAVFAGCGLSLEESDLAAFFEAAHPGCADALMELYELRNELWKAVEHVRRDKALAWLRANVLV